MNNSNYMDFIKNSLNELFLLDDHSVNTTFLFYFGIFLFLEIFSFLKRFFLGGVN